MKSIVLAATTATLLGTAAMAGSYSEPMIEAPVIVEETTNSSGGEALILYMVALTILAAVAN